MNKRTLERWLLRYVAKTDRVDLIHRGADETRVVVSYESARCKDAPGIADVVADILAAAQDEADLMDARCSFTVSLVEGDRQVASTAIRSEPTRDRGNEAAPDEPSKEGVVAMLMEQNRFLHRAVCDAPAKQRMVYEEIITVQAGIIKDQRAELAALYSMLNQAGVEDAETRAERIAEEQRRSEMVGKALGELGEMGKYALAKYMGISLQDEDDTPQGGEPIQ
jgi:hypothetical protein